MLAFWDFLPSTALATRYRKGWLVWCGAGGGATMKTFFLSRSVIYSRRGGFSRAVFREDERGTRSRGVTKTVVLIRGWARLF